jgi:hypothetical protein
MLKSIGQIGRASFKNTVAKNGLAGQWAARKLSLKITKAVFCADR